jgi:hypothetical protein
MAQKFEDEGCMVKTVLKSVIAVCCFFFIHFAQAAAPTTSTTEFDAWSNGDTMRIDLSHAGTSNEEHLSINEVRHEGRWAGSRTQLLDMQNLVDYFFVVSDTQTNKPLFTRGTNSCFDDEKTDWSVCSESIRFPFPLRPIRISFQKRNKDNLGFHELWSAGVDPTSPHINTSPLTSKASVDVILESGSPEKEVDVVILGDGYTDRDKAKFQSDARRATGYIFAASPFKESKSSFNVRSVFTASEDGGITSPLDGYWARTALGCTYDAHDVERNIDCFDNYSIREAAAVVPYDVIVILTNSKRYGGSGNYQQYAVAAIDSSQAEYLVQHELGHTFAGLADEYYSFASACTKTSKAEPWEPNVTSSSERQSLKWGELVAAGTLVPTPWPKEDFEAFDKKFIDTYLHLRAAKEPEQKVDDLIREAVPKEIEILKRGQFSTQTGAFEGAQNQSCGMFRPEVNCIMFTLTPRDFCSVCSRAIRRAIAFYTK